MKQVNKENKVTQVNQLLNELNQSVSDNDAVKSEIQKAYETINKPEKVNEQYNQLHQAISEMNYQFQQLALGKKYHFNSEQNKVITELNDLIKESMLQSGILKTS